ncbi:hypothetical protein DICPUDRAFT_157617 [Dictyostelium purpureum]|uniref:Anaphase-promoting complex subunit 4 WD40 domain-containing protein n=1 Tax=Dictyostelium purpureum TaxID=5786 RepID=F0ZZL5_DICPU|nr:uncharacterized protein DICPUDRAFT_157617 [Dictyostelium purpureum]EGC30623.1 hypothetical protein DICPUDRAFT_157617 [Dictyostelium purpureum]|eukprot:XP_003292858.1 hypothetical protein DICPUDRAFT_157617 [Dictyostelium purpureum]
MSLLFSDEIDQTEELTHLIFQWLNEKGYSQTISSLEIESATQQNPSVVKFGGQLEYIYNEHKELQASMKTEDTLLDEDPDLNELGDGVVHQHLHDTLGSVHSANILCSRFSPFKDSNLIITGSTDKSIKVTNYATKSLVNELTDVATGAIISLDFNPVNPELLLASSMDGSHSLIKVTKEGDIELLQKFKDHIKYVVCVRWSPDGKKFATSSYDKSVGYYVEDPNNQGQYILEKVWNFTATIESIIFTPESSHIIAAVRESNYIHYLNTDSDSGYNIDRYNMNSNGDDHVSFSALEFSITPCKKYLLVSTDRNRLILFKLYSDKQLRNFYGATNEFFVTTRNIICPSGKYVFSTSQDNLIYVWEVANQKIIAKLDGHRSSIRDLCFSPDKMFLASCGFDKKVNLWSKFSSLDN